jgi:hypothetical protein
MGEARRTGRRAAFDTSWESFHAILPAPDSAASFATNSVGRINGERQ